MRWEGHSWCPCRVVYSTYMTCIICLSITYREASVKGVGDGEIGLEEHETIGRVGHVGDIPGLAQVGDLTVDGVTGRQ
jgi:hypothetical protein